MRNGVDVGSVPSWRDPEKYASMLPLDRRALAWQCLCRDRGFLAAAATVPPASTSIMRDNPPIVVVTLSEADHLASWGLLFRALDARDDGGGLCRLAS